MAEKHLERVGVFICPHEDRITGRDAWVPFATSSPPGGEEVWALAPDGPHIARFNKGTVMWQDSETWDLLEGVTHWALLVPPALPNEVHP